MFMDSKYKISIIGDSKIVNKEEFFIAEKLGEALISNGYRIVCGGLGGVMEAVCKGGRESKKHVDGDIIGIIPGYNPGDANQYVDIVIATGLDQVRNLVISNSDAVVAIGGGAGTLTEIGFAWSLKRLLIAYKIKGWSGKVADTKIDYRDRYPDISEDKVFGVSSESEVIEILDSMLSKYDKRFTRL